MAKSKIEWTGHTWNPIAGCSLVSPGCTNCYAMRRAARIERMNPALEHYRGLTKATKAGPVWTGKMALAPEHTLLAPLKRKTPTVYFVNSMSDLFHENVPDAWIDKIFAVMALCPQHTFQILTKRSARMRSYVVQADDEHGDYFERLSGAAVALTGSPCAAHIEDVAWPLPNVWLGVSTEDQKRADERIPDILATPAAVRFVSGEPLLGPLNLEPWLNPHKTCERCDDGEGYGNRCASDNIPRSEQCPWRRAVMTETGVAVTLDWIIVGGESGPGARPMHPDWARSIRDQCAAAETAFFFKQWGEWEIASDENGRRNNYSGHVMPETGHKFTWLGLDGRTANPSAHGVGKPAYAMARVGKARAGRLLDGVTHDATPGDWTKTRPAATCEPPPS